MITNLCFVNVVCGFEIDLHCTCSINPISICTPCAVALNHWYILHSAISCIRQADLPFHQKLTQFRSFRFLIRQIIHKIWIDRKSFNLYLLTYLLLIRLLSAIQCLGTLFEHILLFYKDRNEIELITPYLSCVLYFLYWNMKCTYTKFVILNE